MSAGKITLQANDGKTLSLVAPEGMSGNATDVVATEGRLNSHIALSGVTAYHLLQGNLAVDNTVITQGFNTTLYNGNGSTQSINTGIDMATQWGNDASETFGGLVWGKSRGNIFDNYIVDTVRGTSVSILSNTANANISTPTNITSFNNNGFSVGSGASNQNTYTYASWNFQTTHRVSGTTNHGKAYTCHYNPFTGFTIVKYEGSGIAGHEIPHHLGRKLGFWVTKNLNISDSWASGTDNPSVLLSLNNTNASPYTPQFANTQTDEFSIWTYGDSFGTNKSGNQHILYGWANSYFDEANKLIGNYEIGVYQGTGANQDVKGISGTTLFTIKGATNNVSGGQYLYMAIRDSNGKAIWLMTKRLDSASDWDITNVPMADNTLSANLSAAQVSEDISDLGTESGSYYQRATDTSNLQIQNAIIPFANGIDTNGTKITTLSKNETINGLTLTAGKNYVYSKNDGTYGVSKYAPMYGNIRNRSVAGETPDFFDIAKNKWFTTTGGAELVTNGTFDSNTNGWTLSGNCAVSNGTMLITNDGSYASQTISGLDINKKYSVKGFVSYVSGSNVAWFTVNGIAYNYTTTSAALDIKVSGVSSIQIQLNVGTSAVARFDNISVFEAEPTIGTEITESRNYLNHIVYTDNDGSPLYVEELPKVEYKDSLNLQNLTYKGNEVGGFLGVGQSWQDVISSRASGVTFTNTSSKPRMVAVVSTTGAVTSLAVIVNGVFIEDNYINGTSGRAQSVFIVPAGATYSVTASNGTIGKWTELI